MSSDTSPDALLLIAPGCPHCPVVLEGLSRMVKDASLGQLTVINIASRPESAQELGVRSVPWVRLGDLELVGLHSENELREWAATAVREDGMADYFRDQLTSGGRDNVVSMLRRHPQRLKFLTSLLGDGKSGIDARLGVMACLQDLTDLEPAIQPLSTLIKVTDRRIRTDACEALGYINSGKVVVYLQQCLQDEDETVREVAQEGLERLRDEQT